MPKSIKKKKNGGPEVLELQDVKIGAPGTDEIKVGNNEHENVKDSTLMLLTNGEDLTVKSKSIAKFLLISGKPINEEIARGGPFVMNTKAEILQAVQDYHNDTFVK